MAKKRLIGFKRDLLEDYMSILQEMLNSGEYVATLEYMNDYKTIKKFKRSMWDIQEKIRIFVKEKIEPIRLETLTNVSEVRKTEE